MRFSHCVKLAVTVHTLMLHLDPYKKATGGEETVLHWACQCKVVNEEIVRELLSFKVKVK